MDDRKDDKKALAHSLIEVCRSHEWQDVLLPYLVEERATAIENMAALTDAMQLMRYAGAVQVLHSLIHLERHARQTVDASLKAAHPTSPLRN